MLEKLKLTPLYNSIVPFYHKIQYYEWLIRNKSTLTPHIVKRQTIKKYGEMYGIKTFVETGTYLGTMVMDVRTAFQHIYSIELDHNLYLYSKRKLSHWSHITVIKGDSRVKLPALVRTLKSPVLFWLDAHYSSPITAGTQYDNPLLDEVKAILKHKVKGHIILIDDAYAFRKPNALPSIQNIRGYIRRFYPAWSLVVKDDIIRIFQKRR